MTQALTQIMTGHHQHCDDLFAEVETQVHHGAWPAAESAYQRLAEGIEWHFQAEENRLFPALEAVTGHSSGPTEVMREEHTQLRELMEACREALADHDASSYADRAETLLILLQQHNAKEENILYPMCERVLGPRGEDFATDFAAEIAALCPS